MKDIAMMKQTLNRPKQGLLLAGVLALFSQGAMSGEENAAAKETDVVKVTAPRVEIEIADPHIETDIDALIEALNRRVARDLEKSLEDIGGARIELVIAEVPTRG